MKHDPSVALRPSTRFSGNGSGEGQRKSDERPASSGQTCPVSTKSESLRKVQGAPVVAYTPTNSNTDVYSKELYIRCRDQICQNGSEPNENILLLVLKIILVWPLQHAHILSSSGLRTHTQKQRYPCKVFAAAFSFKRPLATLVEKTTVGRDCVTAYARSTHAVWRQVAQQVNLKKSNQLAHLSYSTTRATAARLPRYSNRRLKAEQAQKLQSARSGARDGRGEVGAVDKP